MKYVKSRFGKDNSNWKDALLIHSCELCGKEYLNYKEKSKYCSNECRGKAQRRRIIKICENCSKEFETHKAYEKRVNCCSTKCKYELVRKKHDIPMICKGCGKEFIRKRKQRNSSTVIDKVLFCSPECLISWRKKNYKGKQNPRWTGGTINYRGQDWYVQRKKTEKRDNYMCQLCLLIPKILHIHHIIPYRKTKDNRLENLISLCSSCHMIEENDFRRFGKPSLRIRNWLKKNLETKLKEEQYKGLNLIILNPNKPLNENLKKVGIWLG